MVSWVVATAGGIFIAASILLLTALFGFLPPRVLRSFTAATMLVLIFLSSVGLGMLYAAAQLPVPLTHAAP